MFTCGHQGFSQLYYMSTYTCIQVCITEYYWILFIIEYNCCYYFEQTVLLHKSKRFLFYLYLFLLWCSSFFMHIKISYYHFSSLWRTCFNISFRACLAWLKTNFLSFSLSEKVFISPLFWKNNLTSCRVLVQ